MNRDKTIRLLSMFLVGCIEEKIDAGEVDGPDDVGLTVKLTTTSGVEVTKTYSVTEVIDEAILILDKNGADIREALEAAFQAGFEISGQGFNGEHRYPDEPLENDNAFTEPRDAAVDKLMKEFQG